MVAEWEHLALPIKQTSKVLDVSNEEKVADKTLSGGNDLSGSNGGTAMAFVAANAPISQDSMMAQIYEECRVKQ